MNQAVYYHQIFMEEQNKTQMARPKGDVVHSGHFMISSVTEDQEDQEDVSHDRDSPIHHEMLKYGYDFSNVPKEPKDTYHFGPMSSNQITIDASLARLFRCMSLAYHGGKVMSPKWKNFKGMKLSVKDKIRLNNAIWRTWHIQFITSKKKQDSLIQFASPMDLDTNAHSRPEAVVMEGKYWKRRIENVVAEYKKWRAFFLDKLKLSDQPGLMWVSYSNPSPSKEPTAVEMRIHDDVMSSDFTDTLFSSLSQQPFHFPNPREIAMHATNSDMMQPGLLQLQPSMVEDMEFDPFQELLAPQKKTIMSFAGSATNDLLNVADLGHLTDGHQNVVASSPPRTANTFNSQPVDFVTNYNDMQVTQNNVSVIPDPTTSLDPIFSSVPDVPFYQPNRTRSNQGRDEVVHYHFTTGHSQVHYQQQGVKSMAAPVKQFQQHDNHTSMKLHPVSSNLQQQQQQQQAGDYRGNSAFHAVGNVPSTMVNGDEGTGTYYPHLKNVVNTPANKITYSNTQISHPVDFLPQNHHSAPKHPHPTSPVPLMVESNGSNLQPHMERLRPPQAIVQSSNVQRQQQASRQTEVTGFQQQPSNVSATLPSSDLKRLLTNKTPKHEATSNRQRKRSARSNSGSPRQIRQNQQFASISLQDPANPPHGGAFVPSPAHPRLPVSTEKRKSDEATFAAPRTDSDVWPLKRKASSSPVKAAMPEAEMEAAPAVPETASPLKQDNDLFQMETTQRHCFSTEQKRRFNIKMAFMRLQDYLPGCDPQSSSKISKASLLAKSAQYIKTLQGERAKIKDEIQTLKQDLEKLQQSISVTQLQLPETGAPASRLRDDEAKSRFRAWVKRNSQTNWKFTLFGTVVHPWLESYQSNVSVVGTRDFCQSFFMWLEEHCSMRVLRPNVVRSLQVISTTTCILTNPSQLRQQIEASVNDKNRENTRDEEVS